MIKGQNCFRVLLAVLSLSALSVPTYGDVYIRKSLTNITLAELVADDVKDQCAGVKNCRSQGMAAVELNFGLNGCSDKLGEIAYRLDEMSGTLYVAGINLNQLASEGQKCIRRATGNAQFTLGGADKNTRVVDLGENQKPLRSASPTQTLFGGTFAKLQSGEVKDQCTDPRCKSKGMGKAELIFKIGGCALNVNRIAYAIDKESNTLYVAGVAEKIIPVKGRCATKQLVEVIIAGTNAQTKVVGVNGPGNL